MRRSPLALIGASLLAYTLASSHAHSHSPADGDFAELAEKLAPSVVNIFTQSSSQQSQAPRRDILEEFFRRRNPGFRFPPSRPSRSLGSGFVVSPDGYIITANHVIENADNIEVKFDDEEVLTAKIVGRDPRTDIALLKVSPSKPLHVAVLAEPNNVRVGQWILAFGNPLGVGGTVTAGIVSAVHRDVNSGPYDDFIQTDAAINQGNSGGPLFNSNGHVVGVVNSIFSPTGYFIGVAFAVPASTFVPVLNSLKKHGEVKRGWLGVRIQDVTMDLAEGLQLPDTKGALVVEVTENSPAHKAGVLQGDVIVQFGNFPINRMRELPTAVAKSPQGSNVLITVRRNGAMETLNAVVGLLSDDAVPQNNRQALRDVLGLSLLPLNDTIRRERNISPKTRGLLVDAVEPNSEADQRGVSPGDVVLRFGNRSVASLTEAEDAVAQAQREGRNRITCLFLTRRGLVFIPLTIAE